MNKIFFIPGSVPSSKNSKVWTGKFMVWSKAAQKYRRDSKKYWELFCSEFINSTLDSCSPIRVSFTFIRGTKHKFDYVNPLQTVLDLMVEFKWLSDDNADVIFPIFEPYQYDKKSPGVLIKVL